MRLKAVHYNRPVPVFLNVVILCFLNAKLIFSAAKNGSPLLLRQIVARQFAIFTKGIGLVKITTLLLIITS